LIAAELMLLMWMGCSMSPWGLYLVTVPGIPWLWLMYRAPALQSMQKVPKRAVCDVAGKPHQVRACAAPLAAQLGLCLGE
jgi:hypothetical protein